MGVLCIVDVQSDRFLGYKPAMNPILIDRVVDEINKAKRKRDIITVTEFVGRGDTDAKILDSLDNYDRVHYTCKDSRDGSKELSEIFTQEYSCTDTEKIYVCGVYTHYCVRDTAEGLAKRLPYATVTVLEDASNDNHYEGSLSQRLARKRQKRPYKSTPKNLKTRKRRGVTPLLE